MKMKIFSLVMAVVLCCSTVSNVASATEIVETEETVVGTDVANMAAVPEPDAELMYTTVNYGSLSNYYLNDVTVNLEGNNVKAARIKISGNSDAKYGCTVTTPDGKTHVKTFYGNDKECTVWVSLFSQSGKFKFHIYMHDGTPKKVTATFKITK